MSTHPVEEKGSGQPSEATPRASDVVPAATGPITAKSDANASPPPGKVELARPAAPDQSSLQEQTPREDAARKWEQAFKDAVRDREIASQLAGRPLVAGAAAQLLKLWGDDFEVREEGGMMRVRGRDGSPLDQAITARLSSPEYAHFSRAAHRGGTGAGPAAGAAPAEPTELAPRTLGEAVIAQWRVSAARGAGGLVPVGLHRRHR